MGKGYEKKEREDCRQERDGKISLWEVAGRKVAGKARVCWVERDCGEIY